jgi:5-oxoprolinase (ATP-hydrolysing)
MQALISSNLYLKFTRACKATVAACVFVKKLILPPKCALGSQSRSRHRLLQEEGIIEILMSPGKSGIPGVVGSRCLSDNLSDLKAQVAANAKGIFLVKGLITEYSLPVVQAYMAHIQANAEEFVRQMLIDFSLSQVCTNFARR